MMKVKSCRRKKYCVKNNERLTVGKHHLVRPFTASECNEEVLICPFSFEVECKNKETNKETITL